MADEFQKKEWKRREVEFPGRRKLTPAGEDIYDVAREEGLIMEEGDGWTPENMNDLEERIATALLNKASLDALTKREDVPVRLSAGASFDASYATYFKYDPTTKIVDFAFRMLGLNIPPVTGGIIICTIPTAYAPKNGAAFISANSTGDSTSVSLMINGAGEITAVSPAAIRHFAVSGHYYAGDEWNGIITS